MNTITVSMADVSLPHLTVTLYVYIGGVVVC